MAKSLTKNVWVDGVLYGPAGKTPSKKVADQITNPKAWAQDAGADEVESTPDEVEIPADVVDELDSVDPTN